MVSKLFKISASLSAASPLNLEKCIKEVERSSVDIIHFDIEDGVFVPNITFGLKTLKAVLGITSLPVEVHLMTINPESVIEEIAALNIYALSVHFEALQYPLRVLTKIKKLGKKAGIALNPKTNLECAAYTFQYCDSVLLMSNEPDFCGEKFLPCMLKRITQAREFSSDVEVDGDISTQNIREVVNSGATIVVCGRSIFGQKDVKSAVESIRSAIEIYNGPQKPGDFISKK